MARQARTKGPTPERVQEAENQIIEYARTVKFTVTEYSFEFIVQKLEAGRYYVPDYQRELVWTPPKKSKFVESVLMGLPIPFVFFWQNDDGRMEIVDGSQRLRTIRDFMADKIKLRDLEVLPALNGFRYSDLPKSRRLKFNDIPIRVIVLDNTTDAVTRTEMFARINTGGTTANDAEIRRGSLPGPFMDLVIELAGDAKFVELTPISQGLIDQREREELVTRFFAYLNSFDPALQDGQGDIPTYKEEPRRFFFTFVKEMNDCIATEQQEGAESQTLLRMRTDFARALQFVEAASPHGFTKSDTGKQVPRVRFESIAVGSALALRTDLPFGMVTPSLQNVAPERSRLMANVKSKNTGPELVVRRALHALGYRFRLHRRDLPGRPDIVMPKHKTAILVHGCFWHRHPGCPKSSTPKTRVLFWQNKFEKNVARDIRNVQALQKAGWQVLIIWECETKRIEALSEKLEAQLQSGAPPPCNVGPDMFPSPSRTPTAL